MQFKIDSAVRSSTSLEEEAEPKATPFEDPPLPEMLAITAWCWITPGRTLKLYTPDDLMREPGIDPTAAQSALVPQVLTKPFLGLRPPTNIMLLLSFLWLCYASGAVASQFAAPFEALTFFKSYLAEWYGNGGTGTTVIAPGCISARINEPCDINEFIDHVYGPHPTVDIEKDTIQDAYRELATTGNMLNAHYNAGNLAGLTGNPTYRQVIYKVMNAVQAVRGNGIDTNLVNALLADIDSGLQGILSERNADQFNGFFRDAAATWKAQFNFDMTAVTPAPTSMSGRSYDRPDYAAAIRKWRPGISSGQFDSEMKKLIANQKGYFNNKKTAGGRHKAPMVAISTAKNTLADAAKIGCSFPTT
ncbi:hypothetical protein JX266_008626 [Neoarthrinium moseri]|nr:hypothetical protein JX266_008626 [Neoarthrinium moseri]